MWKNFHPVGGAGFRIHDLQDMSLLDITTRPVDNLIKALRLYCKLRPESRIWGVFKVRYDSRVVIYDHTSFIRLTTGLSALRRYLFIYKFWQRLTITKLLFEHSFVYLMRIKSMYECSHASKPNRPNWPIAIPSPSKIAKNCNFSKIDLLSFRENERYDDTWKASFKKF